MALRRYRYHLSPDERGGDHRHDATECVADHEHAAAVQAIGVCAGRERDEEGRDAECERG